MKLLLALLVQVPVTVDEYRDGLSLIASRLKDGDLPEAQLAARHLLRVRLPDGLHPDVSLLAPLADAASLDAARTRLPRLHALIEALGAVPSAPVPGEPDPALLERLRARELLSAAPPGAPVAGPVLHRPELPPSLFERLSSLVDRVLEFVKFLLRWLFSLLFGMAGGGAATGDLRLWVVLLIGLVAALLLTALLFRRRRAASSLEELPASVLESAAGRDEDPLSRTASEWERFAAELMRAGRFREAIRAWYHATLVSLFRVGRLHYRKDRTNWEYALQLPPDFAARPSFLEATRIFEREWYGRLQTESGTADAFESAARRLIEGLRGRPA